MLVIFNVNYNGCEVLDNGVENVELSEQVINECSGLYNNDGEFDGSEKQVIDIIKSVVGECEIELDWYGS